MSHLPVDPLLANDINYNVITLICIYKCHEYLEQSPCGKIERSSD